MNGLMINFPLTIPSMMNFAEQNFPNSEIVSVTFDNARHRYTYRDCAKRVRKLANALTKYGIQEGDRIGTLAWNDYRHMELYYAVPGIGAIAHTINPRLFTEQVSYILNHAEDRLLFVDPDVLPLLEELKDELTKVEHIYVLTDSKNLPDSSLDNISSYEDFIGAETDSFDWPTLDENTASSLCYTSGTTGNPKGVLYSHRSTVLHAYASIQPNVYCLFQKDSAMPIVPMFHVNAWGLPYAAPITGAKIVFPGAKMSNAKTLHALIEEEGVTASSAVPTVWLNLLAYLEKNQKTVPGLNRVCVGGAACPLSIIEEFHNKHGVQVQQGWGMTEMSPLGTYNTLTKDMEELSQDEQNKILMKQGRGVFGVEMKIVDDNNQALPWDGETSGLVKVRGPWVCSGYYRMEEETSSHDSEGWFNTGDVATIDSNGYLQITDRTKDIIKSGGEWISSIELENAATDHPQVKEAAVIGLPHPTWTERPLLIVIKNDDSLTKESVIKWLENKVAKWWLPDDVVFVDEIPHTATGKIKKIDLRVQFKDHVLPTNAP